MTMRNSPAVCEATAGNGAKPKTIRLGLYGCNMYRTKDLMDAAAAVLPGSLEVTACFDIDANKARAAVAAWGGKVCETEEIFLAQDMDIVIICLPPYLHAEVFEKCARAGHDVYLEKPICVNEQGRARIIQAAKTYQVRCYVGLSYRYVAPYRKVGEIVHRADAGRVVGVHHHWLTPMIHPIEPGQQNWRHSLELSGGQLIHHCCHVFDWFRWLGGNVNSVQATACLFPNAVLPHEERELTASFQYESGGIAVFNLSQHSHQYMQYGSVHTENYGIQYCWGPQSFVKVYRRHSRAADETYEWSESLFPGEPRDDDRNIQQVSDFVQAYRKQTPFSCSIPEGLITYDMAQAVRESYRTGKRVAIAPPIQL